MNEITTAFERHVRIAPYAPALVHRGTTTSFGELNELVTAAAHRLEHQPPGPVAMVAAKSPEAVATVLAGLRTRRPVLLPSLTLPPATLDEIVEQAGCSVIADEDGLRPGPGGGTGPASGLLLTTSGSTGVPKIVPLADEAMHAFARWADATFGLGPGRRVLNYAPLTFDLCLLDVWGTLASGGCCVLVDDRQATSGRQLAALLADVQVVQGVPLLFELLPAAFSSSTVEHVIVTGDTIRPGCLARLPEMFPKAARHNVYGCTETNDSFIGPLEPGAPVVLGTPLPGVQAIVMTGDGPLIGAGEGELWVSTPFQTAGYLHGALPEKFAVRDGVRYFRSGDLVRRTPDGELILAGRTDFQVKVAGQRVNLQEVEACLLAHPDVAEAAVVAISDDRYGHRLHAVVRRQPGRLDSLELRRHCVQRLPGAAIPGSIAIVDTPLPRTSTGKVDRKKITALLQREAA